jgi:DNA-binding transcriptional regulator YiaG
MNDDVPELAPADFERAISSRLRKRIEDGHFESGADITAIRRFVGLTQAEFAEASGVSVETVQDWEQGRSIPAGPAVSLLRIAARHPGVFRENVSSVA